MDFVSQTIDWACNNILWIIGLVAAFAIAYYFYWLSKSEKKPCKSIQSNTLVAGLDNRYEKLDLRYSGESVKNFTVTTVRFWNEGKQTINKTDVVEKDPIRIEIADKYKILDAKILKTTDERNNFHIFPGEMDQSIVLTFDYIDKGDGIVIQLLHTGLSNDDIKFLGKIKGVKKIIDKSVDLGPSEKLYEVMLPETGYIRYLTILIYILFPVVISGIYLYFPKDNIIIYIFTIMFILIFWFSVYLMIRRKVPKELEVPKVKL